MIEQEQQELPIIFNPSLHHCGKNPKLFIEIKKPIPADLSGRYQLLQIMATIDSDLLPACDDRNQIPTYPNLCTADCEIRKLRNQIADHLDKTYSSEHV